MTRTMFRFPARDSHAGRRNRHRCQPWIEGLGSRVLLSADLTGSTAAAVSTTSDETVTPPAITLNLGRPPKANVYQFELFTAKVAGKTIKARTEKELIQKTATAAGGASYALGYLAQLVPAFRKYTAKVKTLAERSTTQLTHLRDWYANAAKKTAQTYQALKEQADQIHQQMLALAQQSGLDASSIDDDTITSLEDRARGLERIAQTLPRTITQLQAQVTKLKSHQQAALDKGDVVTQKQDGIKIWVNRVQQYAARTKANQCLIDAVALQIQADQQRILALQALTTSAGVTTPSPEGIDAVLSSLDPDADLTSTDDASIADDLNAPDSPSDTSAAAVPVAMSVDAIPPVSPVPPVNPDPNPNPGDDGTDSGTPTPTPEPTPEPPDGWPPNLEPGRPPYSPPIPIPGGGETWTAIVDASSHLLDQARTIVSNLNKSIGSIRISADDLRKVGQLVLGTTEIAIGGTAVAVGLGGEGGGLLLAPVSGGGSLVISAGGAGLTVLGAGLITSGMLNVQQASISWASTSTSVQINTGSNIWYATGP